jgi:hypothetical protein
MTSTRTTYRPARQSDYPKLHRLAATVDLDGTRFQRPTIVVERDGQLVGFATTRRFGQRVTVGPVVVTDTVRLKGLVAIRAVLEIEKVLKEEGRLYYLIGTTDPGLMRICEAFGCARLEDQDEEAWFIRRLRQEGSRVQE